MKKVILKNNLLSFLYVSLNSKNNCVYARDENGNIVGSCEFAIFHAYSKTVPESFRNNYAKKHNLPIEEISQTRQFKINVNETDRYTLRNNLLFLNERPYNFNYTFCQIAEIKIIDERFYKVGLGTAILKEVETIAKTYNCKIIKGMYLPNGDFQFGTQEFYKRNGFKFEKENSQTLITKSIEQEM